MSNEIYNQLREYLSLGYIIDYLRHHFVNLILVIIIISFYGRIKNLVLKILDKIIVNTFPENGGFRTFFMSIARFLIHFFLIFSILRLLGIELSGILAIIGALGIVIGFGFKEVLSNIFGGIVLLAFKPFSIGDVIEYKGFTGTITKIELYYTTLVNFQNEVVIIPNANITGNEIRNINSNSHRRLDLTIGVGYGSNIEQVKSLILKIIEKRRDDLFYIEDVAPIVGMSEIAASSLNFDIRVLVREKQYLNAKYYLNETIKTVFDEYSIELPFNIVDLHFYDAKQAPSKCVPDDAPKGVI